MSLDDKTNAVIVLEAHRDAIQVEIDALWNMGSEQKVIENKRLYQVLTQTNKALEWAKGRE